MRSHNNHHSLRECFSFAEIYYTHTSNNYPARVCASGVKQTVLSVVVVCHKNIFMTADLEAKTISKQEVDDEICHILACVYLVKHRAVSFSAFSTFFLIISAVHHFNTAMGTPQLAASGYPDPDTRCKSTEDGFHGGSTEGSTI